MTTKIRLATPLDLPEILDFLGTHWNANHVFVRKPELFEWQHSNGAGGLNVVLSTDQNRIDGLLGFIPNRKFDPELTELQLALALWKVAPSAQSGSGIFLLHHLIQAFRPHSVVVAGVSSSAQKIYQAMNFHVGQMCHYALFRPKLVQSEILQIAIPNSRAGRKASEILFLELPGPGLGEKRLAEYLRGRSPIKTVEYLRSRFVNHPFYRYTIMGLGSGNQIDLVLILRKVTVGASSLQRVVDILGQPEKLVDHVQVLREYLEFTNSEYLDVMFSGDVVPSLEESGFVSDANLPTKFPTHFEPFEREGSPIVTASKHFQPKSSVTRFFLADTDQDRPNR